jgi:hypothetical protein
MNFSQKELNGIIFVNTLFQGQWRRIHYDGHIKQLFSNIKNIMIWRDSNI